MDNLKQAVDWLGVLCGEDDGTEIGDRLMAARDPDAIFMSDDDMDKLKETMRWGKAAEQFLNELAGNVEYAIKQFDPKYTQEIKKVVQSLRTAAGAASEMYFEAKKSQENLENRDWA